MNPMYNFLTAKKGHSIEKYTLKSLKVGSNIQITIHNYVKLVADTCTFLLKDTLIVT